MQTPAANPEFRHPSFWRGRTIKLFGMLLLAVLLLRLGWGWQARRMATAAWERVGRRGEPRSFEEIPFRAIPENQNAWTYQLEAAGAHAPGVDSPASSNLEYRDYPPYPAEWNILAQASEKANAKVFTLARKARAHPAGQPRTERLTAQSGIPGLSQARTLAHTLGDGAIWAHFQANDLEALERVRDVFHTARSLRQDWVVVSQLVAIGMEALACHRAMVIAPGLRLAPDRAREREAARGLIADLLDERLAWEGLGRSFAGERLSEAHLIGRAGRETWAVAPLGDTEIVRMHGRLDACSNASRMDNWPDCQSMLGVAPLQNDVWDRRWEPRYSRWFSPGDFWFGRYLEQHYRVLAERRATAISLAAQLYRTDHARWPARLEELAPAYLPQVPADPFHKDGRAIGYVMRKGPGGGERPMVFYDASEQEDEDPLVAVEPIYGWRIGRVGGRPPRSCVRQYRDLSRFAPPPGALEKLSPKAVDDDPDQSSAPGKDAEKEDKAHKP